MQSAGYTPPGGLMESSKTDHSIVILRPVIFYKEFSLPEILREVQTTIRVCHRLDTVKSQPVPWPALVTRHR